MGCVIIAIPNLNFSEKIGETLRRHGIEPDAVCSLGSEVLRLAGSYESGIVICTGTLKDMSCRELLEYLPDYFHILMLSTQEYSFRVRDRIMRLSYPFKASDLINTVEMMISSTDARVHRQKRKPGRSPEEQKLIDKAKYLLMDRNDMTEQEAFRYIQKTSMDTGRSMPDSAEMILMMNWDR